MTADGKIAFSNHKFIPFGSRRDQEHMMELRATADAVMAGSRTAETEGVTLGPGGAKYRRARLKHGLAEYNLRVVVSRFGRVNPDAKLFQHRFSPIVILTTGRVSERRLKKLRSLAEVKICGTKEIDFHEAFRWLREKWGVKRLLCEGGGELHNALIQAGLVNELHLTICPKIFGGKNAPTVCDGEGVLKLADATNLKLKSLKRIGDELFLVYSVKQSPIAE